MSPDVNHEIGILRSTLESIRDLIFRKFAFFCSLQVVFFVTTIVVVGFIYRSQASIAQVSGFANVYTATLFIAMNSLSILITYFGNIDLKIEGERLKAAQNALIQYSKNVNYSEFIDYEWRTLGELNIRAQRSYFRRIYVYVFVGFSSLILLASLPLVL